MDFFYLMIAAVFIAGLVIIFISVFLGKNTEDEAGGKANEALLEYMKLNSKMKDVDYVISEADNVITEINDTSKTILNEIDKKHEEMLFLYNLIGEKEKVLVSGNDESRTAEVKYRSDIKPKPKRVTTNVPVTNNEVKKVYKNPKLDEIKELKRQGLSLDAIAKQMNMGKGEISVMLALAASANKAPKAGGANE